jgi:hypothetical protein
MGQVDLEDKLRDARTRVDAEAPVQERVVPKFARLTRKDTRIRADQDAALTALAKSLMRRRAVKTERITENTLIRVAIDLLFAHADALRGSTEEELRKSVSSATPSSGTALHREFGTRAVPHFPPAETSKSGTPDLPNSGSRWEGTR